MKKFRIVLLGAVVITGTTASLTIQYQAQVKLHGNDAVFRQRENQMAQLAAERQRLSDLVAQASRSHADERTAELVKLRHEAEALRKQIKELGKRVPEKRPWRPSH